MKVSLLL
ncbi:Hypothetical protein EIN_060710, partial [Entamoeba invadens IP1]